MEQAFSLDRRLPRQLHRHRPPAVCLQIAPRANNNLGCRILPPRRPLLTGDLLMALSVTKADVWSAEIPDAPGGLADKLAGLAEAGVNLQFLFARRQPDKPGRGLAFISGLSGAKAQNAAQAAGFQQA